MQTGRIPLNGSAKLFRQTEPALYCGQSHPLFPRSRGLTFGIIRQYACAGRTYMKASRTRLASASSGSLLIKDKVERDEDEALGLFRPWVEL